MRIAEMYDYLPSEKRGYEIFSNGDHSFLLTVEGKLYACGYCEYGQMGLGRSLALDLSPVDLPPLRILSIAAGEHHTLLLTDKGEVYACGNNYYGQLGFGDTTHHNTFYQVPFELPISQVAVGGHHSILLTGEGEVYTCGSNYFGQLGFGDTTHRTIFTRVPLELDLLPILSVKSTKKQCFLETRTGEAFSTGLGGNKTFTRVLLPLSS